MSKKIGMEYQVTAKELQINTHGLSFLTISGTHINGAYAAFPGFGVSAELSEQNDGQYNADQLFAMLQSCGDPWLPKSEDALRSIAEDLSEVITPLVSTMRCEQRIDNHTADTSPVNVKTTPPKRHISL